jgi:hypothetical protein
MSGELHAPAALSPQFPLDRGLDGPQRRSGPAQGSCLRLTTASLDRRHVTHLLYPMFVGSALPVSPCNGPVRMLTFLSSAVGHSRVMLCFRLKRWNCHSHFNIYGTGEMARRSSCKNCNRKRCECESPLALNYRNKFIACCSWANYAYKVFVVILFIALFLRSSSDHLSTSYYSWRGWRR